MALDAVVYSYYNPCKDFYSLLTEGGGYDQYLFQEEDKPLLGLHENSSFRDGKESWDHSLYSSPEVCTATVDQSVHGVSGGFSLMEPRVRPETAAAGGRRKRRRTKSTKNKEEIENQRMTHIAVERNRRKQMNEFLAVLRSLMPPSYVQRVSMYFTISLYAMFFLFFFFSFLNLGKYIFTIINMPCSCKFLPPTG